MEGTIVHFRGSKRVKRSNQMVVQVSGVDSKDKASQLVGRKVLWKTSAGKQLTGQITNIHGNTGALRVRFDTGMPGQSIGSKVVIE
ncbi:50S ribosomal protein L35ae [Candidatus Woesearchaeota archaeon]|nr:50S ribosomal protein L35ae [Candidatus Woesearchaeota archaeon]